MPAATPVRAFPTHARPDRYFPSQNGEEVRRRVAQCVERGDGTAVVIGAPGIGKTMLLEVLAQTFASQFAVTRLDGLALASRRALLQSLLCEWGQPFQNLDDGELQLAVLGFAKRRDLAPQGHLLLVDDGHSLAMEQLLELQGLSNVVVAGQPRIRLVLAGGPELEETCATPQLKAFSQRIGARGYLAPLRPSEVSQYIRAHAAEAGADPDALFTPDAFDAVQQATDGVPRLVNQLCDRAIVMAVEAGANAVTRQVVEGAWADWHQLPAPSAKSAKPQTVGSIEFGALDEEFDTATPMPIFNADEALTAIRTAPAAVNPFLEEFPDEEMVLDRYASLEAAFRASTPRVTNQRDPHFSRLLAGFVAELETAPTPPSQTVVAAARLQLHNVELEEDELLLEEEFGLEIPVEITPVALENEPDILVIDEDEPVMEAPVRRQEYRQLFSSLRRG